MGRIYKDIGFGGLWNGLPVRIVMIGTLTGTFPFPFHSSYLISFLLHILLVPRPSAETSLI
jgi:hypothetical protein